MMMMMMMIIICYRLHIYLMNQLEFSSFKFVIKYDC